MGPCAGLPAGVSYAVKAADIAAEVHPGHSGARPAWGEVGTSVWRARRRLQALEHDVAEARSAQAALQQRLEAFEQIAAAAGAPVPSAGDDDTSPLQPVPPTLLAAAQEAREKGSPVRLPVDGGEVIAVIGDEGGDPREWWAAIHRLAGRLRSAS
jgi:Tfp pilus assembly protein FimV